MHAELDPTGASPHEPGAKLDGGKPPVFRGAIEYFPRALREIAMVSLKGAEKYTWKGWKDVPEAETRYLDALMRHLMYVAEGKFLDDGPGGTNMPHIAQVAWNALAVLELTLERIQLPQPITAMSDLSDEEIDELFKSWGLEPVAWDDHPKQPLNSTAAQEIVERQFGNQTLTGEQLDLFLENNRLIDAAEERELGKITE